MKPNSILPLPFASARWMGVTRNSSGGRTSESREYSSLAVNSSSTVEAHYARSNFSEIRSNGAVKLSGGRGRGVELGRDSCRWAHRQALDGAAAYRQGVRRHFRSSSLVDPLRRELARETEVDGTDRSSHIRSM